MKKHYIIIEVGVPQGHRPLRKTVLSPVGRIRQAFQAALPELEQEGVQVTSVVLEEGRKYLPYTTFEIGGYYRGAREIVEAIITHLRRLKAAQAERAAEAAKFRKLTEGVKK